MIVSEKQITQSLSNAQKKKKKKKKTPQCGNTGERIFSNEPRKHWPQL